MLEVWHAECAQRTAPRGRLLPRVVLSLDLELERGPLGWGLGCRPSQPCLLPRHPALSPKVPLPTAPHTGVGGCLGVLGPPASKKPARAAPAHTEGCLFFICRGIVASILVFLCFGVTQAKDGPFSRPHPGNLPFLFPCVPRGGSLLSGRSVSVLPGVNVLLPLFLARFGGPPALVI